MIHKLQHFCLLLFALIATNSYGQTLFDSTIETQAEFNKYTVIDANNDNLTWTYDDYFFLRSNRDYSADDWLITPAINLTAGKTYKLTFNADIYYNGAEKLRVLMGNSATVAAMSEVLSEETTVDNMEAKDFTIIFVAQTSGNKYFGFHHCTVNDPYSNDLNMHRIKVEETSNQGVPGKVSDIVITPAAKGELKATVSFKAPSLAIDNSPLSALTKIEVKRDGVLIKTFNAPVVGTALSFEDTGMTNGSHTYSFTASNSAGAGETVSKTTFIGEDVPGAVANLKFSYDYNLNKSTLTWSKPTAGANGGYINTDNLTYEVRRIHIDDPEVTGLTNTSFEENITVDFLYEAEEITRQKYSDIGMPVQVTYVIDGQGMMGYYVAAVSSAGRGAWTSSNSIVIGDEYTLPFKDSFSGGNMQRFWQITTDGRPRWSSIGDVQYCQDNDGGMLLINGVDDQPATSAIISGNIDMTSVTNPILSFYVYGDGQLIEPLKIKASAGDNPLVTLKSIDILSDGNNQEGYSYYSIPLTDYAGKDFVKIAFEITLTTATDLIFIDNVRIIDQRNNDLAVEIAALPRTLKVGETRYMTAAVENLGINDVAAGTYSVMARVNNTWAGTATGDAIAAGNKVYVSIPLEATVRMNKESEIYVDVLYSADEMTSNNRSDVQTIIVKMPNQPVAENLTAALDNQAIKLSWNAPKPQRTTDQPITESFEDYDDFCHTNFGEWTLYDGDVALTYGLGGWHFQDNSNPMAYMVFNPSQVENEATKDKGLVDPLWKPVTGEKSLASFGAYETESDDWLISPELSGNAQTISFYAKHMPKASNADQFSVLYSTSGMELSNFISLDDSPRTTTAAWDVKYEYALPQGTKYFAIHKTTYDGWVMFIDDITFVPDTMAAQTGKSLIGYNVYRNSEKINGALITTTNYTDANGKPGDYYYVTAVYDDIESGKSNYAQYIDPTGIDEIETVSPTNDAVETYYDLQGRIVDSSYRGVVITNGKKLIKR